MALQGGFPMLFFCRKRFYSHDNSLVRKHSWSPDQGQALQRATGPAGEASVSNLPLHPKTSQAVPVPLNSAGKNFALKRNLASPLSSSHLWVPNLSSLSLNIKVIPALPLLMWRRTVAYSIKVLCWVCQKQVKYYHPNMTVEQVRNTRSSSVSSSNHSKSTLSTRTLLYFWSFHVAPDVSHFQVLNCWTTETPHLHVGELGEGSDSLAIAESLICPSSGVKKEKKINLKTCYNSSFSTHYVASWTVRIHLLNHCT